MKGPLQFDSRPEVVFLLPCEIQGKCPFPPKQIRENHLREYQGTYVKSPTHGLIKVK